MIDFMQRVTVKPHKLRFVPVKCFPWQPGCKIPDNQIAFYPAKFIEYMDRKFINHLAAPPAIKSSGRFQNSVTFSYPCETPFQILRDRIKGKIKRTFYVVIRWICDNQIHTPGRKRLQYFHTVHFINLISFYVHRSPFMAALQMCRNAAASTVC